MKDRKLHWFRKAPTRPVSHIIDTTHTRASKLAQDEAARKQAAKLRRKGSPQDPDGFDQLSLEVDLARPNYGVFLPDDLNLAMDMEGDSVFLEREIGQLCEPFETHIPPYFREIDNRKLRRQGRLDTSLPLTYSGETPVAWHVDPQDRAQSRKTYYYQFRYRGIKGLGRRTLLSYEQGLTREEAPNVYKANLTHLLVGLNNHGKVDSLHIYPPHPNHISEKAANVPYGITRIGNTPRLKEVLDVLNSLADYNNMWVHLDFKDRRNPSLTLANKYTFTFTDKGFTLTKPEKDPHNLAGKLGEILTAPGYAFLVEEMLSLVELDSATNQAEAVLRPTL